MDVLTRTTTWIGFSLNYRGSDKNKNKTRQDDANRTDYKESGDDYMDTPIAFY